jgi:hypothetical protein
MGKESGSSRFREISPIFRETLKNESIDRPGVYMKSCGGEMRENNCLLCEVDGYPKSGTVHVPGYEFDICQAHWEANHGGWDSHYERSIIDHLNKNKIKIPPKRDNGFFPRDYT